MGTGMPTMAQIASYWRNVTDELGDTEELGDRFYGLFRGWGEPFCFACGWMPPVDDTQPQERAWTDAASWLERAHIIPRSFGGDNACANLIPLCRACHRSIDARVFAGAIVGRSAFLRAVRETAKCGHGSQLFTDWLYGPDIDGQRESAMADLRTLRRDHPDMETVWAHYEQLVMSITR